MMLKAYQIVVLSCLFSPVISKNVQNAMGEARFLFGGGSSSSGSQPGLLQGITNTVNSVLNPFLGTPSVPPSDPGFFGSLFGSSKPPAQTTYPTQPTLPTYPTQPALPTYPTQPALPTYPTQPALPTYPTLPTVPAYTPPPTKPVGLIPGIIGGVLDGLGLKKTPAIPSNRVLVVIRPELLPYIPYKV